MTFDDWCAAYGGGWHDAAQWLRDNYQDHQTIAGLCDAMVAAAGGNLGTINGRSQSRRR